ncbi:hypothetical protein SPI_08271 [Niveomyces insectorum RCEF 264]|uniref:TM7S3/TM198-like domain-containing protein n=1 Tax=Niveomyces insectorum RCEF 264 TaxID=1081102 RepID=A0A167NIF9_9HYPO|nr:hypothetical protein SPI_08271 [Niveomyces insectorum RCEF 264]
MLLQSRRRRLEAFACMLLCVHLAAAGLIDPFLRAREGDPTNSALSLTSTGSPPPPPPTTTAADTTTKGGDGTGTGTVSRPPASTVATTETKTTSASSGTASSIQATATLANGTSSLNTTLFNTTIPAGQLPIRPVVTPGWGVAGTILLLTGAVYGLIGIKKQWLHTFFSTAYLAGLGTAVLIVYVMSPPISNAVQGAYVVAAVCAGLLLGGIAIVFKEITEGFGCLLGGFCLSMWLLCLRQGGLIQNTSGTIGFIVAFTVGAFVFYFSRWTRQYALIVCVAFGGATATVLGIDAFSRAGLKEFWVYIWNLNDNLFPLGTVTYPLTKGIRVELAATILLFMAGVVSQLKLWRIVQEHRAKRQAEREVDELKLRREEENVGRQIEASNARERQQWEAVYGDGNVNGTIQRTPTTADEHDANDSGVGDTESEKRGLSSQGTSVYQRQSSHQEATAAAAGGVLAESDPAVGSIELADLQSAGVVAREPAPAEAAVDSVMTRDKTNGTVTVRVAQDDFPEGIPPQAAEEAADSGENHALRPSLRRTSRQVSAASGMQWHPTSGSPNVVPLPFTIPVGRDSANDDEEEGKEHQDKDRSDDDEDDINDDDDRSSVATFADEDDIVPTRAGRRRSTIAKRLSQSSADLFRSLSQRSKRASAVLGKQHNHGNHGDQYGESNEELIAPPVGGLFYGGGVDDKDGNESVAATIDGMSFDGDDDNNDTIRNGGSDDGGRVPPTEVYAQLSDTTVQDTEGAAKAVPLADRSDQTATARSPDTTRDRPVSHAATASTDVPGLASSASASDAVVADAKTVTSETTEQTPKTPIDKNDESVSGRRLSTRMAKSTASADSAPVSLTKERLPRSLSRIALSYRTNEWAKHLSNAEAPEPDALRLDDHRPPASLASPPSPSSPTALTAAAGDVPTTDLRAPAVNDDDDDDGETPAPLNVAELQQTATTGAPPLAAPRSSSSLSLLNAVGTPYASPGPSKSFSSLPLPSARSSYAAATGVAGSSSSSSNGIGLGNGHRSLSSGQLVTRGSGLRNEPIAEETSEAGAAPHAENAGNNLMADSPSDSVDDAAPTATAPLPYRASMAPVPGVVSYNGPQTLIGQRDMLLRSKSQQGFYIGGPLVTADSLASLSSGPGTVGTAGNSGYYAVNASNAAFPTPLSSGTSDNSGESVYNGYVDGGPTADPDDLPLNQRKAMMRNSSLQSLSRPASSVTSTGYLGGHNARGSRLPVAVHLPSMSTLTPTQTPTAGSVPFDSHQPVRNSAHLPTPAAREAQLATFRNSLAAELRMGAPAVGAGGGGSGSNNNYNQNHLRESLSVPLLATVGQGGNAASPSPYARESDVQQSIAAQRAALLSQKEAEAQRHARARLDKERNDRAFEERMRRGDLLEAHRDALRRMQAAAREA